MELRTFRFNSPAGYFYEIREQNGADEDILSNPMDVRNLMNITKFISAIVVKTDFTPSGKLTIEDADRIPLNDRYLIIFQSRIFSLGEEVEFEFDWGMQGGKISYAQDLREFIFSDYSQLPTEKELEEKPNAIPYYPVRPEEGGFKISLSSDKVIKFDLLTGAGERYIITLPQEKQTRNASLMARNLHLEVDGKFEKVENFSLFSVRDMAEMRRKILEVDPVFTAEADVENPSNGQIEKYPIMLAPSFFYLTEA